MLCLFVENVSAILESQSWVSPDWSLPEIRNRIRHRSFRRLREGVQYFRYIRAGTLGGSREVSSATGLEWRTRRRTLLRRRIAPWSRAMEWTSGRFVRRNWPGKWAGETSFASWHGD